jgi:ABC-2 type transport system permease protein
MNTASLSSAFSWRRLKALCWKESLQIVRDPTSKIISVILPIVLLFIFGYGINLDSNQIRIGLLDESDSTSSLEFKATLQGSAWFKLESVTSRQEIEKKILSGQLRGVVILPSDFESLLLRPGDSAPIQVIADGSDPQTASFVQNYVRGASRVWLEQWALRRGEVATGQISVSERVWFNPSALSRNYLIPGSITIIITVIGALLTSLVVAREWERGTMEALLASPASKTEFLLSKLIPYYLLGIVSLLVCAVVSVFILGVPFRGSVLVLWLIGSFYIFCVLGIGLLISTLTRNQFNASQAALNIAFLPALMLSGFIYEIASAPPLVQGISHIVPARYFVNCMQTIFLAGNLWAVLLPNLIFLIIASGLLLGLTHRITRTRME